MNKLVLHNNFTSRLSFDSQIYAAFGSFASDFADIDPTEPTTIHLIGSNAMIITHFVSDMFDYLVKIYGTADAVDTNVKIQVDTPHAAKIMRNEFIKVEVTK